MWGDICCNPIAQTDMYPHIRTAVRKHIYPAGVRHQPTGCKQHPNSVDTNQLYLLQKVLRCPIHLNTYTHTQELGEERGEGVVFSVVLKRVRYSSQETSEGHLQWKTCRVRTLRAGTVERLVEHLAPFQDDVDVSYRTCFLCTYRTFTTTSKVLQLLTERSA